MHQYPSIPEVYRANSTSNILSNDNKRIKQFNKHINGDLVNHNFNNINQINTITQQNLHHHQHHQQHQQHQQNQHHTSAINLNTFNLNKQQQQQNCINNYNNNNNNNHNNTNQKNEEIHKNFAYDKNNYLLWIVTPVAASFSIAIVIAALAGPQWLFTEEKLPNTNYNGTANYNLKDDGVYLTKFTKSSLWILCASQGGEYYCSRIDYFPKEEYSPDPNDSTMAIPYAITRSTPFFLISGLILLISYILFLIAICSHHQNIFYFISGVLFIISGLLMLIGLIMYISVFKAEIGSKLRPKSSLQPPLFTFKYGQSFILYVVGFVITEFVGVLNVFLYIRLQQTGHERPIPCLNYPIKTSKSLNDTNNGNNFDVINSPTDYTCKRHPKIPNSYFSPISQRRYYFDKQLSSKCDIHSRNLAKSLNELYTEPAPPISPFDYPNEFPLTRSVSTATDIFLNNNTFDNDINLIKMNKKQQYDHHINDSNNNNNNKDNNGNCNDSENENDSKKTNFASDIMCGITKNFLNNNNNNTSNNKNNNNNNNASNNCLNKKQESNKMDKLFGEFCKKVGPRPPPKDIYFIEDTSKDEEPSIFIVNSPAMKLSEHQQQQHYIDKHYRNNSLIDIQTANYTAHNGNNNSYNKQHHQQYFDNYFSSKNDKINDNIYHSRTLPRDFLKKSNLNLNTCDNNRSRWNERRISCGGLLMPSREFLYPPSQLCPPLTTFDHYQQQRGRASYDQINGSQFLNQNPLLSPFHQSHLDNKHPPIPFQWPRIIPKSPSSFSMRSTHSRVSHPSLHATGIGLGNSICNINDNYEDALSPIPILSTDDQDEDDDNIENENDLIANETFDLDQIERERRKSHASLFDTVTGFQNNFDYSKSTAV